ncbi:MAG: DUF779 domain-containing protein [Pseudomonadota bacterium]
MRELPASLNIENPAAAIAEDGQVIATRLAVDLLEEIKATHGNVSLHHQGGYANGAAAMCLPFGELRTSDADVLLGVVRNTPVFVFGRGAKDWEDRQFVLDAIIGNCGSFSLDSGTGRRFFVRSRPYVEV